MSDKAVTGSKNNNQTFTSLVRSVRDYHGTIDPQNVAWRIKELKALRLMLQEKEADILKALQKDLGKSATESRVTELSLIKAEIDNALKNVKRWAQPETVATPMQLQPGTSQITYEPYGTALIIGAWNYPMMLTLSPLVGAIAAGNAAIIKPSEIAPESSKLLARLLPQYLDKKAFKVVQGGKDETTALLEEKFDKILFTGSRRVGEIVMAAAAKHVTPVTLELGGKCPAIVDRSADLELAARRIVFGKFTNAGQTCVAPDYVLVHEDVAEELTAAIKKTITDFYGDNPQKSSDYARIINAQHHDRLVKLLDGEVIAHGGDHDVKDRYIAPTVLANVATNAPVMKDEIFGPILPVMPVKDMTDAFNYVTAHDKPLALYMFAKDKKQITQAKKLSAGGMCINDTIVHPGVSDLPFGGVGASGFGKYHGEAGFKEFSNVKSVFNGSSVDMPVRYPPYGRFKKFILKLVLK